MKTITQAEIIPGMRVFVRADFDVPLQDGKIQNYFRVDKTLPTLKYLLEKKAKLILGTKLGRPKGQYVSGLSTKVLVPYLDKQLGIGNYELLENLRFDPREKKNDNAFAQELASKADIYVNECFATSHREETSIVGIPALLPGYAGLRLFEEISTLKKVLGDPDRPLVAVIGGVKLESKKPAVLKFINIADAVLVGGKLGQSWDEDIPENLHLPVDYAEDSLDIGPKTVSFYTKVVGGAKTVVWAGPLGYFEDEKYITGTNEVAQAVVHSDAFSIIGGGDTTAAFSKIGLLNKVSFASTGGGAMLEFLIKGNLPGLKVLGYYE